MGAGRLQADRQRERFAAPRAADDIVEPRHIGRAMFAIDDTTRRALAGSFGFLAPGRPFSVVVLVAALLIFAVAHDCGPRGQGWNFSTPSVVLLIRLVFAVAESCRSIRVIVFVR